MARGTPLPPSRSSARIVRDMLGETCPEELERVDAMPEPRPPPSPWLVLLPPFAIVIGVVLVAALHDALGSPLGAQFAVEIWGIAKSFILPAAGVTGLGVYVVRNNERAWRERERLTLAQEQRTEPDPWQRSIESTNSGHRRIRSGSFRALPPGDRSVMLGDDEEDDR